MNLERDKWEEVKYGDYVDHVEINETNIAIRKKSKYVSVEHIETGNFKISSWFSEEMPTFFRTFKKGQILFGKRRAYQRKVAIAEFDGICSPHIWALEAKGSLLNDLLPYIMLTERFYEYVNANSAGTMSVYLKWPQLSRYSFLLPPIEEQHDIAHLFQSLETALEEVEKQEKNLKNMALTLIKSLTEETPSLGTLLNKDKLNKFRLGEIAYEYSQREDNPRESKYDKYIGSDSISRFDFKVEKWQSSSEVISSMKVFEPNDYLLVRRSLYASDFRERAPRADFHGLCSGDILTIKENKELLYDGYLLLVLNSPRLWKYIVANASGSITRRIKWQQLSLFEIAIPDVDTQKIIVELFYNILTTVEQLKKQKITLRNLKQNLLREILE